jgi:hypothetical protein
MSAVRKGKTDNLIHVTGSHIPPYFLAFLFLRMSIQGTAQIISGMHYFNPSFTSLFINSLCRLVGVPNRGKHCAKIVLNSIRIDITGKVDTIIAMSQTT